MMSLTPLLWDTTSYLALLKLLLTWVLYNPHNGRAVFPNILATSYNVVELQEKFDELEQCRVFWHPEDVGVTIEYFNPSFLVKKPSGRFCLVMAFTDIGQYSRPQPLLMPDVILLFAPSSHESTSLSLTSPAILPDTTIKGFHGVHVLWHHHPVSWHQSVHHISHGDAQF